MDSVKNKMGRASKRAVRSVRGQLFFFIGFSGDRELENASCGIVAQAIDQPGKILTGDPVPLADPLLNET